jgi:Tol biopolymer transport system component
MSLRAFCVVLGVSAVALPVPDSLSFREPVEDVEIHVIGVDGTGRRNVSRSPDVVDTSPVVSPDGRRIAFLRGSSGSVDVWVMNADGTGQSQRTSGAMDEADPAWAPNSRAMAFTSSEGRPPRTVTVRIVGWARSEVRRPGTHARFSPGGRAVVFEQTSGISVLRRTRAGVVYRRLLRVPAIGPVWSPAGKRIAYERVVSDTARYIAVMNADGRKARRLAAGSDPTWSARGLIAFVRAGELFVVQPSGRGLRKLTSGPGDAAPTWSRDGRWLAFVRGPSLSKQIWVIGADGRGLTRVTSEPAGVLSAPSWSPDGRRLYYAARTGRGPPIL